MAAKKPQKKSAAGHREEFTTETPTLGTLKALLSTLPDEAKLDLASSLIAGPPADFFPAPQRPRTKAQREVDHLVNEARSQDNAVAALSLLIEAEAAAKKAVGKRFDKFVGRMGDNPAGRAYLEVKAELAQALTMARQREAALGRLEEIYRLDPADPLVIREFLLARYLDLDRNSDAADLLENDADEPWAAWLFGRVLLALRRGERGPAADDQLKTAHRANPYVLSLLLNERMPDPTPPASLETGEDSEAQSFAVNYLPAWRDTPGAISWLRESALRLKLEISPRPKSAGPPCLSAQAYADLPASQHPAWMVILHQTPKGLFPSEGRPINHWLTVAFSSQKDLIGLDAAGCKPSARQIWSSLTGFMLDEEFGGRPESIHVYPASLEKGLKKNADRAKISLHPLGQGEQFAALLSQLTERLVGGTQAARALGPDAIRRTPLDVDEVWEAAVVHFQGRLKVTGHSFRPATALVMSRTTGLLLWHELFMDAPPPGALSAAVQMAITRPAHGPPRRPRQVVVRDPDEAMTLAALSDEAEFLCTTEQDLSFIDNAVARLFREFFDSNPQAVLTKGVGTTPADLERFYEAAAAYYRARPWKQFASDELLTLDWRKNTDQRRYALIIGQSGLKLGMTVFQRLADIEAMLAAHSERIFVDSWSVTFGEEASIAPADLDTIEQFGWPIATPEAYPGARRIHPGPSPAAPCLETPTAEDLQFLTASLEAIATLAKNRDQKGATVSIAGTTLTATRLGPLDSLNQSEP